MKDKYWIWSLEQQAFRKRNRFYTRKSMEDAGQFTFKEAIKICQEMNKHYVKELMCPTIKTK